MFLIIWEFLVKPGCEAEFERAYGPAGDWSALFRRGRGYLGTELLRDERLPRRYITIDRWDTPEAYHAFQTAHRQAYEAVDAHCEDLTESETELGLFVTKHGS
jgi:heme-degrading monooxygenase HmoA